MKKKKKKESTAGRCKSPNAKSYMHTYRQDNKICTPSPRPSARQKDMRVTIVSERLLGPFIAILVVSSADAQLSLSLGQHNTDQADVVRGLIKISAHISLCYISRTEFCSANNTIYSTLLTLIQISLPFSAEVQYLT